MLEKIRYAEEVPVPKQAPQMILETDAAHLGWGAHLDGLNIYRMWATKEGTLHINQVELRVIRLALKVIASQIWGKHVLVRTDSTIAMY